MSGPLQLGLARTAERVVYVGSSRSEPDHDRLASEAPLEIRIHGVPIAVVMRTPGDDEELVMGFLVSEGIVRHKTDLVALRHCSQAAHERDEDNVMLVVLHDAVSVDLDKLRRNMFASSSCGICGKTSIARVMDALENRGEPSKSAHMRMEMRALYRLPEALLEAQRGFRQTGGLHAAGLFDEDGRMRVVREDVGRHNAVDKVIGWQAVNGDTCRGLFVSGRVSFEVVQKAVMAGIELIAAVSAPTSLAVDLARELGLTLVCFVRGERCSVYSGEHRLVST